MTRNRIYGHSLLLALLSAPAAAQTSPPGPPSGSENVSPTVVDLDAVEARKAFEEGVVAYQSGDYALAAERFARAQLLKPHPEVLLNLAQSQLKAKQYAESATNFQAYLVQTQRENATARHGLTDAKTQVAEVTILAPEGSSIVIDSVPVGTAPLAQPMYLVPGRHEVVSGERSQVVEARPGDIATVDLLSPAAPPRVPPTSPSTEESGPPRRLRVDEWFVRRPGAWVGAGITAGSLVFSAIAATTAGRRYDAAEDAKRQIWDFYEEDDRPGASPCGTPVPSDLYVYPCNYYADKVDSGDTWRTASIVTLVVGLVAASSTVAYYFLDPENEKKTGTPPPPSVNIESDPTTGRFGMTVSGQF